MLWKVKKVRFKTKLREVFANFADSSAKDALVEKTSLNVRLLDGNLTCAPAVTQVVDAVVSGAVEVADGIAYSANTGVFFQPKTGSVLSANYIFSRPSVLYCPKVNAILFSQEGVGTCCFFNGAWALVSQLGFNSLAWFGERVFGTQGNKICFSDRDNPTSWLGDITLPCEIVAVVACKDGLLAVGNDIFKIDFDDDTKNTEIFTVYRNVGKVYGRTAKVVGDSLFFLTSTGLFCLKDGNVKFVDLNVKTNGDNSNACGAVTEGKYWLSFAPLGSRKCTTVAEINCQTLAPLCYHNISTNNLYGGERLLFNVSTRLYAFISGHSDFTWNSREYDFGVQGKKHFRKIYIQTSQAAVVHLITESEEKVYEVPGSDRLQKIPIGGAFESFCVQIVSVGNTVVSKFGVVAEVPSNSEVNYVDIN